MQRHAAVSELIITYIAQRVVAIICRLSHISRLSATASNTGTLRSSIRIVSPHPSRAAVACHTADTPDDMGDIRCCQCCLPASRPAQATTIKKARKTEEERQRQPRKVLHMPASVNITARCKKQAQKVTDEAFGEGGGRPPWLRHCYLSLSSVMDVIFFIVVWYRALFSAL